MVFRNQEPSNHLPEIKRKDEVLEKIDVLKFSRDATFIIVNVNFAAELYYRIFGATDLWD